MARFGKRTLLLLFGTPVLAAVCSAGTGAAQERQERLSPDRDNFPKFDDEMYEEAFPGRTVVKADAEKETGAFSWLPALPKPKLPALPKPSLPKLPGWGDDPEKRPQMQANEPSTWEKLNAGTKNMMTKTKHTLMPWTADDETAPRRKPPATRRTARATTSKAKAEKKSFFSSWLETREEEKPVETVNDYLALPRVPYE